LVVSGLISMPAAIVWVGGGGGQRGGGGGGGEECDERVWTQAQKEIHYKYLRDLVVVAHQLDDVRVHLLELRERKPLVVLASTYLRDLVVHLPPPLRTRLNLVYLPSFGHEILLVRFQVDDS
jgi:hypothetical protein